MRLGEILIHRGLINQAELDEALAQQRAEGGRLGNHLVALGMLTIPELLTVLRTQKDIEAAIQGCEHTVQKYKANFGETHPHTAKARCQLARAYLLNGRATEALAQAKIALEQDWPAFRAGHAPTEEAEQIAAEAREAIARVSETTAYDEPTQRVPARSHSTP